MVGDFNAPSHLDRTPTAVGSRPNPTSSVEWPISKAPAEAGFRDTYREVHPDPLYLVAGSYRSIARAHFTVTG